MSGLSWIEKLSIGGKTTINYVAIDFACKAFFVLGMLHIFIQYLSPRLNNRPRANKSLIPSVSFERPQLASGSSSKLVAKNDISPESTVLIEPEVLDELEPEVVAELVSLQEKTHSRPIEVEESLIEISVDLLAEPTMELLSSSPVMRVLLFLRSVDIYDLLQIFLQTSSQEIKILMVQSTIGLVFSGDDLSRRAACILLKLPSIAVGLSRKLVLPPP